MTLAYAVIPTHNRPAELRQTIASLGLPAAHVLVVDNASTPPVTDVDAVVVRDDEQPPNLSRLWNIGLDWARAQADGAPYVVAVLNDDLVLPPGFMAAMIAAMDRTGAVIAYPDQFGRGTDWHNTTPGPIVPRQNRLAGYAFVIHGRANLRADEQFRWWYGDDDLEWQAQLLGGLVLVGGVTVEHLHPNASTADNPELREQSKKDKIAFVAKWGQSAWERKPGETT